VQAQAGQVTTTVSPGFTPLSNHVKIAFLTLARVHRAKIDCVVRFHHENERPILANLDGLRRDKRWRS
jgi:hypothetical protein